MGEHQFNERRRRGMYDEEVKTAIALIKQKSEFIEEKLIEHIQDFSDFKSKFDVTKIASKDDLDKHGNQDRWMFGLIITLIIGIFVKLVFK